MGSMQMLCALTVTLEFCVEGGEWKRLYGLMHVKCPHFTLSQK